MKFTNRTQIEFYKPQVTIKKSMLTMIDSKTIKVCNHWPISLDVFVALCSMSSFFLLLTLP